MSAKPQQRLAKYIAMSGHCSRRAAERLITQGRVSVNGILAKHTDTVSNDDVVMIDQIVLTPASTLQYLAYHKPVGVDCNNRPGDPSSLYQLLRTLPQRLFAVGRLDKDSSGLLLLTNDGALCQRLMHPSFYHEKAYKVQTDKTLTAEHIEKLASGVSWQLGTTQYHSRPCLVTQTAANEFDITLTQGLHRQIRYMCKAVGLKVLKLQRYRIHNLLLGDLAAGELRDLRADELSTLLALSDNIQPEA
ncbi:MAG: rRNA pseudouridine synthase [Chromatiaceae bacterium]|nr:rRNA pseudouridine synthase [Chromatiaceae bacterium]